MKPNDLKELPMRNKLQILALSPSPNLGMLEPIDIEKLSLHTQCKAPSPSPVLDLIEIMEPIDIEKLSLHNKRKARSPSPSPLPATDSAPLNVPVKEHRQGNHLYRAGKCAELADGTFMRIHSLSQDSVGNIWLSGDHLVRATLEGSMHPRRRNELVWLSTIEDSKEGSVMNSVPVERNLADAIRIRRINFTNQRYERLNTRTHANAFGNPYDDVKFGELFCRIRRVRIVSKNHAIIEDSIRVLTATEADEWNRVEEQRLRKDWRGICTKAGGSYSEEREVVSLDGDNEKVYVQKYTLGDAFCGGGGITRGAFMADLQPVFGFDCDDNAIRTYSANFKDKRTDCLLESVDQFIHRVSLLPLQERQAYMVDILHISPPCQPFSPAHTVPNEENDARNEAVMFSVLQLLQTLKPRVVTVEETFGLLRHMDFLSALVHIFVSVDYSIRWRICNFVRWGVPQSRKRLLFIAAAPGEKLPPFPRATHGEGLKKPATIQDTLDRIPRGASRQEVLRSGEWPKMAFSSDTLCKTLTCNGGQKNYHPSGTRAYTIREMASLQTFPWYHLFPGKKVTTAKRQIGNAVPPLVAKVLYQEIVRTLKETDSATAESQNAGVEMVLD